MNAFRSALVSPVALGGLRVVDGVDGDDLVDHVEPALVEDLFVDTAGDRLVLL
ncbi:MAG: hypothetical protein M3203_01615 [Actinomycetota bacterium]|nr:hypothetical protein [Actinomycetota bacterium]